MAEFLNTLIQANINSKSEKLHAEISAGLSCFMFCSRLLIKKCWRFQVKGLSIFIGSCTTPPRHISSFWVLPKIEETGATVHFMTEKLMSMVILQRRFFVHPSDTIYCVNKKRSARRKLLIKALIKLKRREEKATY